MSLLRVLALVSALLAYAVALWLVHAKRRRSNDS